MSLTTPDTIRTLQRKLYAKAKQEPAYRFYALYDKISREDILSHAWRLVRANRGSSGVDGISFEAIENGIGVETLLRELARDLQDKTYQAQPVRRVMIPKADGSLRPLGIPTIRDRVAQMAVKLIIEPIFEADFCPHSYGFRPKKSAHDAMNDITSALWAGYTQVIDADLSKYFDSIPHAKLMAVVAERIVDGGFAPHQFVAQSPGHWRRRQRREEERRRRQSQSEGYAARRRDLPATGQLLLAYSRPDMATAAPERKAASASRALRRRLCGHVPKRCRGAAESGASRAGTTGPQPQRGEDSYRGCHSSKLQFPRV